MIVTAALANLDGGELKVSRARRRSLDGGYSSGELAWLITKIKVKFDSRPSNHTGMWQS